MQATCSLPEGRANTRWIVQPCEDRFDGHAREVVTCALPTRMHKHSRDGPLALSGSVHSASRETRSRRLAKMDDATAASALAGFSQKLNSIAEPMRQCLTYDQGSLCKTG